MVSGIKRGRKQGAEFYICPRSVAVATMTSYGEVGVRAIVSVSPVAKLTAIAY